MIKVCASGGVLSEVDHPVHQQFTSAELRAIVEVAGLADRVVAAHCHGKPGILAALEAGCRTIEHGSYLDEECAAAMRECGAILVPTRTIIEEILDSRAAPPFAQAKLEALADRHAEAMAIARQAGVRVAAGSDLAVSGVHRPASLGPQRPRGRAARARRVHPAGSHRGGHRDRAGHARTAGPALRPAGRRLRRGCADRGR